MDRNGNFISAQGHAPFGEVWYQTASPAWTSKWKFTSYERDAESGNDYATFRYHVNRLGRFSSPDPIAGSLGNPQSLNRYAYVGNDPTNLIDPLGLDYISVTCTLVCSYLAGTPVGCEMRCYETLVQEPRPGPIRATDAANTGGGGAGKESFANCVKNIGNAASLQTTFHAGNSWLAGALLGNSVSSLIQFGQDIRNSRLAAAASDLGQAGASNVATSLAQSAARNVPNITVSVLSIQQATLSTPSSITTVTTASGTQTQFAAGTLARLGAQALGDVFFVKTAYDVFSSIGAGVVCLSRR